LAYKGITHFFVMDFLDHVITHINADATPTLIHLRLLAVHIDIGSSGVKRTFIVITIATTTIDWRFSHY